MPGWRYRLLRTFVSGVAVCVLLLRIGATVLAQDLQWKLYSYPPDGFAASFPSQPDTQKKNIETPAGLFELRSYVASAGDASLFVSVCNYGGSFEKKDPSQLLLGAKNSALANSGAHLLNEKSIALGPNQGLQFEAETLATHYTARFYIVGSTLYQAIVVFPLNKPFYQANEFLDSFQLITKTPASPSD